MKSEDEFEYLLKIVLVGNSGVGKTKLLEWFTYDKFEV